MGVNYTALTPDTINGDLVPTSFNSAPADVQTLVAAIQNACDPGARHTFGEIVQILNAIVSPAAGNCTLTMPS